MGDVAEAKARLRSEITAARAARSPQQRAADATALAHQVLQLPELREPVTVAAYVSFQGEPGTAPLLDTLQRQGHRVLVPVLLPDRDLDWTALDEPGSPLGVDAIASARVVVCPGLAGDQRGARLGRGGGSYDRALARCGASTLRVLLLHDDELVERLPTAMHDQPVDAFVTPTRTVRVR